MSSTLYLIKPHTTTRGMIVAHNIFKIGMTTQTVNNAIAAYGKDSRILETHNTDPDQLKTHKNALVRHFRKKFKPFVDDGVESLNWFEANEVSICREFRSFVNTLPNYNPPRVPLVKAYYDSEGDVIMTADHKHNQSCSRNCSIPFDILYW